MKKHILINFVIAIVFMSVGVSAAIIYTAKDIEYNNSLTTATNVEEAIDELYEEINQDFVVPNFYWDFTFNSPSTPAGNRSSDHTEYITSSSQLELDTKDYKSISFNITNLTVTSNKWHGWTNSSNAIGLVLMIYKDDGTIENHRFSTNGAYSFDLEDSIKVLFQPYMSGWTIESSYYKTSGTLKNILLEK